MCHAHLTPSEGPGVYWRAASIALQVRLGVVLPKFKIASEQELALEGFLSRPHSSMQLFWAHFRLNWDADMIGVRELLTPLGRYGMFSTNL